MIEFLKHYPEGKEITREWEEVAKESFDVFVENGMTLIRIRKQFSECFVYSFRLKLRNNDIWKSEQLNLGMLMIQIKF